MMDSARQLAALINGAERVVVFTGAGISTESGIPDFRSPGGVWSRYQPVYYDEFMSSHDARRRYWAMKKEFYAEMDGASPNPAHEAVAEFHRLGKLHSLITQNIDGLHQDAGVPEADVIELHGTNRWIECQSCHHRIPAAEIQERLETGEEAPQCHCGGWLKPATISFGQAMPEHETRMAAKHSGECDLFIVVGSSLVVYPAASMPEIAVSSGAKLAIVNRDPTPFDSMAVLTVSEPAGVFLPRVVAELEKLRSGTD